MSKQRSAAVSAKPLPGPVEPRLGFWRSWVQFWFAPTDPAGLHVLRVLTGMLFLAWLLPFAGHVEEFFGLQGWFDRQALNEAARPPQGSPAPIGWSILYLAGSDPARLNAIYWLSIAAVALFTLGLGTRLTGVLTWVVAVSFTANPAIAYDVDALLLILAFYLMIGYLFLNQRDPYQSRVERLLGPWDTWLFARRRGEPVPSIGANVAVRLLQVHFAVVVFVSGLHKLQMGDWWSGAALWYPLHPPFETPLGQVLALKPRATEYLFFLSLATYLAMAWQIGFPMFAWRRRWRPVLLAGAAVGWWACAFVYRLPLFGPAYLIGCLSFVTAEEWRRVIGWLPRVPGLGRLVRWLPVQPEPAPEPAVVRKETTPAAAWRS